MASKDETPDVRTQLAELERLLDEKTRAFESELAILKADGARLESEREERAAERRKLEAEQAAEQVKHASRLKDVKRQAGRDVTRVLQISSRLSHPDVVAQKALGVVQAKFKGGHAAASTFVSQFALGTAMNKLSTALNAYGGFDETARFLLSDADIVGGLVLEILKQLGVRNFDAPSKEDRDKAERFLGDRDGVRIELENSLKADDGPRHLFLQALAKEALKVSGTQFAEGSPQGIRVIEEMRSGPVPLGSGRVVAAVEAVQKRVVEAGNFPRLVDEYLARDEVLLDRFTPSVKAAMVRHLVARGVKIETQEQMQRFDEGDYDEYFAVAYEQASSSAAGDDDPIVAAGSKGATVAPWDFTVDTFDSIEEQGIAKDNILAAGALDYVYELGERLGIFRLVDALTLNWAAGAIDVVDGPCAAKLYRYWKLRDQRMDPSERGLVYKRVLNKGETEALDRMVVNEGFEGLWGTMAEKVAEYRAKVESAKAELGNTLLISRVPIYQAVRDLQYNLTEFCTGMAHMQVREMYAQLRDSMDLLGDPEIVDHFAGGRRKTMWTAIERLARSEFGEAPNINAIRIAAVEGNAVFRFVAGFSQSSVVEEEFQRFIEAAEAWIIAKGSDDSGALPAADEDEVETDEDSFDDADA